MVQHAYNCRPIDSRIWPIERRHFQWTWTTPNPVSRSRHFWRWISQKRYDIQT